MRYEPPEPLHCPTCKRIGAYRANGDVLHRRIAETLPSRRPLDPADLSLSPPQRAAAEWYVAITACLRREMAPHPRCGACSILMGPGHIEAESGGFCGTCRGAGRSPADPDEPFMDRSVFRRGLFRDHPARS